MNIGERIRKFRTEKGLTQNELGARCNMADSAIRRYESDRGNPTIETLERIATALGVPLSDLCCPSRIEMAQDELFAHLQHTPNTPSGERIKILFETADFDPMVVCYNLDIDQSILISWIERQELPPRPIIDKILNIFYLQASQVLSPADLRTYNEEASEYPPGLTYETFISASTLSSLEDALIRKFRALDDRGRSAVLNALEHEYASLSGKNGNTDP